MCELCVSLCWMTAVVGHSSCLMWNKMGGMENIICSAVCFFLILISFYVGLSIFRYLCMGVDVMVLERFLWTCSGVLLCMCVYMCRCWRVCMCFLHWATKCSWTALMVQGQDVSLESGDLRTASCFHNFFLFFFCIPQLHLWGSPILSEISAYVTIS